MPERLESISSKRSITSLCRRSSSFCFGMQELQQRERPDSMKNRTVREAYRKPVQNSPGTLKHFSPSSRQVATMKCLPTPAGSCALFSECLEQ